MSSSYKKMKSDTFDLISGLIESNKILTQSLQYNEKLSRKLIERIRSLKTRVDDLEQLNFSLKEDWEMCDAANDKKLETIHKLKNKLEAQENNFKIGGVN
tara:strand:+ start:121 stop:420 length:300 start_codon:yes stop_codon:yes gene_type:complete